MRKLYAIAVISVVFLGAGYSAEEMVGEPVPGIPLTTFRVAEDFPFQFKVQYWRSDGTAMFRDLGLDPDVGPWESQLEYPMDGNFVVFGAEYGFASLGSRVGVDFNYGFSQDIDGTTRDWDWVRYDSEPLVYAEADTDAQSHFLNANVYYRLWGWGPRNSVDVFVGYHAQENSFTNNDVRLLIPEHFAVAGKVAEYEMDFKGVRAGVRMNAALSSRFTLRAMFAAIPCVDYAAEGKWLLRDLRFSQSADGYGVDFDLYLDFEVARNVNLLAGIKYLYLRATEGQESGYSQGMRYGPSDVLDEAESDQFGGTAGVLVKF